MHPTFQIESLPAELFDEFLAMNDEELQEHDARWVTANERPGFPCRVSLEDAKIGERVLLMPYKFHDAESPYQASGPIYVRENVVSAKLAADEGPAILGTRRLALRAYDETGMLIDAALTTGPEATEDLRLMMLSLQPSYVQIHNAVTGCFFCSASPA